VSADGLGVVMPFWLDRPDEEAVQIARAAESAGITTTWVGEMASFDAFALATAIGLGADRATLVVGPLAVGVRSPVAIALGVSSVATLTGRPVDIAVGASSPAIVAGWHGRPWEALAPRAEETVTALRALLAGERGAGGFRLRRPQPGSRITVAAFGPAMTRVAGRLADRVVLNIVPPAHVTAVREQIDVHAAAAARPRPQLAVWVAAALEPGELAHRQLAGQLAVYLAPPGYGELFASLGHGDLVNQARAGARRADLVAAIPKTLIEQVAAVGTAAEIRRRIAAYRAAGADHVALVPVTAEDPAGRAVLEAAVR
jgi:probable F420-dependent oxidoreductase